MVFVETLQGFSPPSFTPRTVMMKCQQQLLYFRVWKSKFESKIYESSIEFDESKMKDLLKKDKFLQRAFKSIKGKEKEKLEKLFNTFIIDDSKMEKEYKKN